MTSSETTLALFTPQVIRERAQTLLALAEQGKLVHVEVDPEGLADVLVSVLETTMENYPDLQIPPYGVWRDFEAGGIDRWGALAGARGFESAEEMLAATADLAVLGTMLRTMRPEGWIFEDPMTATRVSGRQASALAAFHMFASGSFSSQMSDPYRVDAETLIRLELEELASGLQWDREADADLLDAMQRQLKRFGEALALRPDLFADGDETRPGLLATGLAKDCGGAVEAGTVLDRLLEALAPVWEGGAQAGDILLGDSFRHKGLPGSELEQTVPFHLAAQEMVYALVEPFAWAGLEVSGLEDLSAPADDRHAALFLSKGVLKLTSDGSGLSAEAALERMIEVRAAASALTDRLAGLLRAELNVPAEQLPLTCILEGGTSRTGSDFLSRETGEAEKLGKILNPGSVFWLPFGA
ncbi:DUF1688 family protein [Roseibium sp.]|uniref:DUF1688 family protein n=1 Tax=Roseibium sp. TaxID=1936156 RepID=UPI003D0EB9B8